MTDLYGNNMWGNYQSRPSMLPRLEVIKVNGEAGARAFNMAPNSSQFLADTTNANRIWLAQTDGGGYLTVTPLDVAIPQPVSPPDFSSFEERINNLEKKYEQLLNSGFGKQSKKQRNNTNTATESVDTTN